MMVIFSYLRKFFEWIIPVTICHQKDDDDYVK